VRRLLVTGGAGFIGANFVHYWIGSHPGDRVVVLDALTYAGNMASLEPVGESPLFRFVHGDIRDETLVAGLLADEMIDTIVHFAAESHVDRSIAEPDAFIEVNVGGTHKLLEAARRGWLSGSGTPHRFHHISTDEVYGSLESDDPAFTEANRYAPNSPYAASKAAADHLVRAYRETYGLETTISNCSNNYGPFHYPEKLIPLCLLNLLEGKPLPIYGDGSNVRDWLYVEDHCRGIELILERGAPGETYNLGGNCEKRNLELVETLCALVDAEFERHPDLADRFPRARPADGSRSTELITFVKDRPGHDRRYAIDATKARQEIGFEPETDFESGLRRTLAWYLEHEDWWESVRDGSYRDWIASWYDEPA
jgi:dTDP-glucose 4,6-dehydratase